MKNFYFSEQVKSEQNLFEDIIIESLKKQDVKDEWIYIFLKNLNIHKIHFSKQS